MEGYMWLIEYDFLEALSLTRECKVITDNNDISEAVEVFKGVFEGDERLKLIRKVEYIDKVLK